MFDGAKGLWNLAKEKIMKERGELPNEEGDAVREHKAMHEENFWSNSIREDERGKEERKAKTEKNEEEQGEKRTREEERKKRTKWERSKEDVRFLSLWWPLKSLATEEIWRVTKTFLGKTPLMMVRTGLVVGLILVRTCVWCLM